MYVYILHYCWYTRARYYQAHAYQFDFLNNLKNQFAIKLRHLRRTRELGTRLFNETNRILQGLFLFRHNLENYFEKRDEKWIIQN